MSFRSLDRAFRPTSVAVIGASPKPQSLGNIVLSNLLSAKFAGRIFPINPKYSELNGLDCLPAIEAVPEKVDLAIVCTPAASIPKIAEDCQHFGVAVLLVLSAGFREVGPAGLELEERIRRCVSVPNGMRVIGPNCLGIVAPHAALNASFAIASPKPGRTALISQSGAVCTAMMDWADGEGIGFSVVASLGNALDVDIGDMIEFLAQDPNTDSIVLYIESVRDAKKFIAAARAFTRLKPIVAYKAGRFAASAQAAASHTGALVGEDSVFDAAFARCGIVRVYNMNDLFNCAEILARSPLPAGPRLAIVSNAGGPAIMATDALLARQGQLAEISGATICSISERVPAAWSHQNPVDILGDAPPSRYRDTVELVMRDPQVDGLVVILTPQSMTNPHESARAVIAARDAACGGVEPDAVDVHGHQRRGKPLLSAWIGGPAVSSSMELLNAAGIPTYSTPEQAIAAFQYLDQYRQRRDQLRLDSSPAELSFPSPVAVRQALVASQRGMLNELASKQLLQAYGIACNATELASTAEQAVHCALQLAGPVVMKVVSDQITHKSTVGGVLLNLQGEQQVREGYRQIMENIRRHGFDPSQAAVSIQPMVMAPLSVELIVGVKRDATFGPVIMLGSGGTATEIWKDRVIELPPLDSSRALRMIRALRVWPLLDGFRNRPKFDVSPIVDTLMRVAALVAENPEVVELDINPLLAMPDRVVALDARVRMQHET